MELTADIEVLFEFNNCRKKPIWNGYRPMHLILDNYLTSGTHRFKDRDFVMPGEKAIGEIRFLTPEAYPNSCWIGKRIRIQEGERVVGWATVTRVVNPILLSVKQD